MFCGSCDVSFSATSVLTKHSEDRFALVLRIPERTQMSKYQIIAQSAAVLGTLFYRDPTSEENQGVLDWLALPDTPSSWEFGQPKAAQHISALANSVEEEGPERLHESYKRFFVGPYKLPAPAWGSVYTDPESVLFGNETLAVRQWMRDNLVRINLKDKEPEDQFGLMLLMASWAINNDVADDQVRCLFEDHLLPWSGRFLELFTQAAEDQNPEPPMANVEAPLPSAFYAALGNLAQVTLADWQQRFDWTPRKAPLSR